MNTQADPLVPAEITISPTSGPSGTEVTISGSHFSGGARISITFDGYSVSTSPETVSARLDGSFTAKFVVPEVPAGNEGEKIVRATDNFIGYTDSATFQLIEKDSEGSGGGQTDKDPAARSQSIRIAEDTLTLVKLRTSHPNDEVRFLIVDDPLHGELSDFDREVGTVRYLPNENYFGSDKFTFRVQGSNVVGTVSITIESRNDIPIAKNQQVDAIEESSKQITLSGSDVESDNITFSIVSKPAFGKLTGNAPNVTYLPNKDYFGFDSFSFRTNDGVANSNVATVSIRVAGVNDSPIVDDLTNIIIKENDDVRITLVAADIDSEFVNFSIVSDPAHGTLTRPLTTGPQVAILTYAPDLDYSGKDAFSFVVNDGNKDNSVSKIGKVNIRIGAGNNPEPIDNSDRTEQSPVLSSPQSEEAGENNVRAVPPDTLPPRLNIPSSPIEVEASSEEGAIVIYATAAADDVDGTVPPLCSPASGSVFPVGTITVRCSATDKTGNGVEKTFMVSVRPMEGKVYMQIDPIIMIPASIAGAAGILVGIILVRRRRQDRKNETPSSISEGPALP
jgi:hypothetical protein